MDDISLINFLAVLVQSPALMVTVFLTLAVIFVNGWTDAPNSISTVISTRAMRPGAAIFMAAICNLAGVIFMTLINQKVAETIYNLVDLGDDAHKALIALCAAMIAIVLWTVLAWKLGIPTSESHALIAGLSGAAIALQGSLSGINGHEWLKVVYGLGFSLILGFGLGFGVVRLVEKLCKNMNRAKANSFFGKAQILSGAGMSFMHGAQDGQKFMGVFLLGMFLAQGETSAAITSIPIWIMVLCASIMGIGTSVGGYPIIKTVGMKMVKLERYQGFSADMAGVGCLLLSSLTGVPVSTSHTKSTSIMGVGAARNLKRVNWGVVKEMMWAWILTFPGCGLLGFFLVKLFLLIF